MLTIGEKAPLFDVSTTEGELDLAALVEDGPLVLYFFPKAFTPG